jgi:hypothetical protein
MPHAVWYFAVRKDWSDIAPGMKQSSGPGKQFGSAGRHDLSVV